MKQPSKVMLRYAAAYRKFLANRPAKSVLVPAVAALLASGKLHEFDAEWIGRLRPDSQLASAKKCIKPSFTMVTSERRVRSTITHGRPNTSRAS